MSRTKDKRRRRFDDDGFYDGVNVYDYGDEDDAYDDYGGHGGPDVGPRKPPIIKRVEALEAQVLDGSPASDDLSSRIKVLEGKIKKPGNIEGMSFDERLDILEDIMNGCDRPRADENKSMESKITKLEKKVMPDDYDVPEEFVERVGALEAAIRKPDNPNRLPMKVRVNRLYAEIFGEPVR